MYLFIRNLNAIGMTIIVKYRQLTENKFNKIGPVALKTIQSNCIYSEVKFHISLSTLGRTQNLQLTSWQSPPLCSCRVLSAGSPVVLNDVLEMSLGISFITDS